MKYARLTKEQLEELHQEFITFLASQSITAAEWEEIKSNTPNVAEDEIDVFSDLIWEGVLNKVEFLEHFSKEQIHLFHLGETQMYLIAIKVNTPGIDLTTTEGYNWLREHLMDDTVLFFNATKAYNEDRNMDKFKLIQEGAQITKGKLFEYMNTLVEVKQ